MNAGRGRLAGRDVRPALHPDLRGVLMPTLPFHRLWLLPLLRLLLRASARAMPLPAIDIEERHEADVHVRIYRPQAQQSGAALLWIHGGGLILGSPVVDDQRCAEWVRELGLVVVSAYYRLAPEHPFPAAIDDCVAAWRWLQHSAEALGVDPRRVAIGGESAGGGLAASLAHRLRDEGGVQPAAQLLVYPMLDDRTAARRDLDGAGHRVWGNRANRAGWSSYLAVEPGAERVPAYSVPARREDLGGLPPAWIGVGLLDLFHAEDRLYARRLEQSGIQTVLHEVPGAPHGFYALAPDAQVSRTFRASQVDFLRSALGLSE